MAFPYVIGEYEAVSLNSGGAFVTTAGKFDADTCRGAMSLSVADFFRRDLDGDHNEVWVHGVINPSAINSQSDARWCVVLDSNLDIVCELQANNGTVLLDYYNGSGITSFNTGVPLIGNTLNTIDLHVLLDNSVGVFGFYLEGILIHETTPGDTLHDRQCAIVEYDSITSTGTSDWSECIINDTTSTLGRRLLTLGIDADGSTTDWGGDFTDIDEVGDVDDGTFIDSTSAGNLSTFTFPAVDSSFDDYAVDAVVLASTATADGGSAPQNIRHSIDSNGSTDEGADFSGLTAAFSPGHQTVFALDPDTASAWDISGVNALEIGVESQT